MSREEKAASLVQVLLGFVFLATGIGKAIHFASFARTVALLPFVPHGLTAAAAVCVAEMTLGLLLLSGWRRRPVVGITCGVLGLFLAYTLLAGGSGKDCGCFIGVAPTPSFGWHLTLDILLLASSVWLLLQRELPEWLRNSNPLRPILSLSLTFLLLIGSGVCLSSAVALRKIASVPQIGERFPEVFWTSPAGQDSKRAAMKEGLLVVFMRADCHHCAETLPKLRAPVQTLLARGAHILLVAPSYGGDFSAMTREARVEAPILIESQDRIRDNFHVQSTPTFVWYSHGAVEKVMVGGAGVAAVVNEAQMWRSE